MNFFLLSLSFHYDYAVLLIITHIDAGSHKVNNLNSAA